MGTFDHLSREELIGICDEVFALRRRVVELDEELRKVKARLPIEAPAALPAPATGFAFNIADATGQREFVVEKDFVKIGTHASCGLQLASARWMHAFVERKNGRVTIGDFGTPEGTFVNGQKITGPTELAPGDRITICDAQLVISFAAATAE